MSPQIYFNGRFLDQEMTGVQRYAQGLLEALGAELRVVRPHKKLSPSLGHLWEQVALPLSCGKSLLWSPGNTGPLAQRHQIVTIHDTSTLDHPEWFSSKFRTWYRFLLPRLAAKVRKIITVSRFSKERLLATCRVPAEKVEVIYNAIDPKFRPADLETMKDCTQKYNLHRPYCLFVGSIEPRKNLAVLLQAWKRLALRDAELILVGGGSTVFSGPGFDSPPPGTRQLGRVPDEDLPALLSAARCFAFPSIYEGFGFPPLEAMACGCPVVSSNATSLPEVCGPAWASSDAESAGAVLYFDPRNVEELAEAIRKVFVLDSASLKRLRCNGLTWSRRYNWKACSSATLALLNQHIRDE